MIEFKGYYPPRGPCSVGQEKQGGRETLMIAIIDYEMGNLRSVQKGFEAVGHEARITRDPRQITEASHVVLPGVGAFGDCMHNLKRYGLTDSIFETIESGKPFLGICVGFQLLFEESEEFGRHEGLGILPGRVKAFLPPKEQGTSYKIPHMGWNTLHIQKEIPPLQGLESGSYAYFVHSFYVDTDDESLVSSKTEYGVMFPSSIWKNNIFATQFHPEKSQSNGLRVLKNFGDWQ